MTSHCYSSHEATELLSEPEGEEEIYDISVKENSRLNCPGWVKVKRVRKNYTAEEYNK